MTDKEEIIIDGCNVSGCENYRPKDRFTCYPYICNCHQKPDCHYKQLARKTQECEQIKEKYEALKLENQEGYEIVDELKQECEELKKEFNGSEKWRIKAESLNEKLSIEKYRYRKALEEIEEYVKTTIRMPLERKLILDIIRKAKGEE